MLGHPPRKKLRGLACEGAGRSCMDEARHLRKTRFRLIGPPLFLQARESARVHVLMRYVPAGTQVVACQVLELIYDRCHTWIRTVCAARSSAMTEKGRRPRIADKDIPHRLMSAKPQRGTLQTKKMQPEDVSFMPAAPAKKNTESWLQGSKTGRQAAPTTRPPKNTILEKERLPKRTQKWDRAELPRGPIFVTAQNKTQPALAALPVAHPRARIPLALSALPALAIPCSWPAICIDLSNTLDKRWTRSDPAVSTA